MRFTVNLKLVTWHVIILLAGLCLPVAGQATRGSLSGQILDTTGAAVPGAKVMVKNDWRGVSSGRRPTRSIRLSLATHRSLQRRGGSARLQAIRAA